MSVDEAELLVSNNREVYEGLLAVASRDHSRGRFQAAAARLQSAARFAWYNHPGFFRDHKIEASLALLAAHLPDRDDPVAGVEGHVVHVVTQAYSTGGHTKLIARWIANDPAHAHSVVFTGQQGLEVPRGLLEAVAASGGRIVDIGLGSSSLMARAAELRRVAAGGPHSFVLHIHPYDVVPSIGLQGTSIPVVFLNHADHVFSLGLDVADVVADIRPAGQRLTLSARRVDSAKSVLLPIPLAEPEIVAKSDARGRLGIPADATVVLSIASPYKYSADDGEHFADLHSHLVQKHPKLWFVTVGPEQTEKWEQFANNSGGRALAVGIVSNVADYYAAADIYVDSIPFASLTSLLDAGLRGIPVLAFAGAAAGSVLSSDDISLGDGVHFADKNAYLAELEAMISRPEYRSERGSHVLSSINKDHLGAGWRSFLNGLYVLLETDAPATRPDTDGLSGLLSDAATEPLNSALAQFQIASGLSGPPWEAQLRDAPYLPLLSRIVVLSGVPARDRPRAMKDMLPDALRSRLKRIFAKTRK